MNDHNNPEHSSKPGNPDDTGETGDTGEFDNSGERELRPELNPRIWIGSLADYNAGRLHGDWFDATLDEETLLAEVQAMLDASPEPLAEEYAIFDFDEFGAYKPGEYEPLHHLTAIARGIQQHGDAFSIWADLHDGDPAMLDAFEDAYLGHFENPDDWARDMLAEIEEQLDTALPQPLRGYVHIDYPAWLRDCQLGGDIHLEPSPSGHGFYLFQIH